ncbi:TonB-dependent receptor [Caulobacter sp. 73W]|uniref:TonB-dependent receptor n=1 Tax=Caulobacter sp. 73W TaxID=3161137 RepID=A0AB39KWA8_9CAUL
MTFDLQPRSVFAAMLMTASALTAAAPAFAQEQVAFDVPSQDLRSALNLFSRQAGVQILFPSGARVASVAPAVQGRMTRQAALSMLLKDSGLEVASDDGRIIALRAAAAPAELATLTEIVVTAQKREQRSLDVPFALTAYNGRNLERLGVTNFRELSSHVPGLMVEDQSPNNAIFVMRGINSAGGNSFAEPRVSIFQDGVSISKSRGSFVELFDNERIEVAKGPQSTLFGRGALIGAINVIQNKAGPDLDWSVTGEAGNYGLRVVEGMVNMPLSDVISVRLAGRYKSRDGYMDNLAPGSEDDLNAIETQAYRAVVSLRPNDRFRADLIVNHQQDETNGTGFKSMYRRPTDPATGQVLGGLSLSEGAALAKPADFFPGEHLGVDQHSTGATLLASLKLNDSLTLNSVTGYRDVQAAEIYDADGISLPVFTSREDIGGEHFSQELRLNYDAGGRVTGFIGGNFYRERADARVDVRFDERMLLAQVAGMLNGGPVLGLPADVPAPAALFGNTAFTGQILQGLLLQQSGGRLALTAAEGQALAARLDTAHVETSRNGSDTNSYDVFGDLTFKATDRLELSAGLRYTRDEKATRWASSVTRRSIIGGAIAAAGIAAPGTPTAIGTARGIIQGLTAYGTDLAAPLPGFGVTFQPTAANGAFTERTLTDDGLTWRANARYAVSPQANLYASYSRGRRPAVLSAAAPGAPGGTPVFAIAPSEQVDTYEVGGKFDLLSRRLRLDLATYYYDYENFQTREQRGSTFVTTNAGKARAYGVESQMQFAATADIDLFATYAYNHARFTRGAYDGNRLARSPDHSLSVGASLRHQALGGTFDLRPVYTYRSKIFFADDNDRRELQAGLIVPDLAVDEFQNGVGLLNVRLSYRPDNAPWEAEAFVTNATDETYRKGAGSAGKSIGLPTNVMAEPRFYGLRLTWRR